MRRWRPTRRTCVERRQNFKCFCICSKLHYLWCTLLMYASISLSCLPRWTSHVSDYTHRICSSLAPRIIDCVQENFFLSRLIGLRRCTMNQEGMADRHHVAHRVRWSMAPFWARPWQPNFSYLPSGRPNGALSVAHNDSAMPLYWLDCVRTTSEASLLFRSHGFVVAWARAVPCCAAVEVLGVQTPSRSGTNPLPQQ
jgi:hypothetical protein